MASRWEWGWGLLSEQAQTSVRRHLNLGQEESAQLVQCFLCKQEDHQRPQKKPGIAALACHLCWGGRDRRIWGFLAGILAELVDSRVSDRHEHLRSGSPESTDRKCSTSCLYASTPTARSSTRRIPESSQAGNQVHTMGKPCLEQGEGKDQHLHSHTYTQEITKNSSKI